MIPDSLKRISVNFLTFSFALLNVLIAVEFCFQLFIPLINYSLEQKVFFPANEKDFVFQTSSYTITGGKLGFMHNPESPVFNEYGIFGKDTILKRQPGTFRILVLGDSVTDPLVSCRYPYGYTFTLEQLLSKSMKKRPVVMNAGVGGYNTVQEAAYLELFGEKTDPDLVILAYVNNDFSPVTHYINTSEGLESLYYLPEKVPLFVDLKTWNQTVYGKMITPAFLSIRCYRLLLKLGYSFNPDFFDPATAENILSLGKINDFCSRNQIPLVLVHFPVFRNLNDYESQPWWNHHEFTRNFCRNHNIKRLDLYETYRRYPEGELFLPEDLKYTDAPTHPGKKGNRIAAEAICQFLISQGLVETKEK